MYTKQKYLEPLLFSPDNRYTYSMRLCVGEGHPEKRLIDYGCTYTSCDSINHKARETC